MRGLIGVLALALVAPLAGCATQGGFTVTGRVADDTVAVQAPSLPMPRVNLDAGFTVLSTGVGRPQANSSPVSALVGLGGVARVAEVAVDLGDRVTAGQVLLRFDDAALSADRAAAKADAEVARRQVAVLAAGIDETYDKERDLDKAEKKVRTALADLATAQRQLTAKLATARQQLRILPGKLAEVSAQLAQAQAALAALPPEAPPEVRAQLEAAVAQLTAAKAQLTAGIAALKQGIPKLAAGLKKIAAGRAKARAGLRTISSGRTKLADARTQLRAARSVAVVAADAAKVGVSLAGTGLSLAVLTAPEDGYVVQVADVGAVLAPGATAVLLRPEPDRVTTFLAPEQLAQVCVGDRVTVRGDWMTTPLTGKVARLGTEADYPPTSFPTDEVHLTRAVGAEITLEAVGELPVGVPLDIRISPCRPAGTQR